MGNAPRHLAVGDARPSFGRAVGKRISAASAAIELATEVLTRSVPAPAAVERYLASKFVGDWVVQELLPQPSNRVRFPDMT